MTEKELYEAFSAFTEKDGIAHIQQINNGLINKTYLLHTNANEKYILQKINTYVFTDPYKLMDNIFAVTEFLAEKNKQHPEEKRKSLRFIKTVRGEKCFTDSRGGVWRLYHYVEGTVTYDKTSDTDIIRQAGSAFGHFVRELEGYDASTLNETVKDFHNTPVRYSQLINAAERDIAHRKKEVEKELEFIRSREGYLHRLTDLISNGLVPLRVTHNDTKLNNLLFDENEKKAVCVIDLDTVMPGISLYDFGDSIRSGAVESREGKAFIDMKLFESYAEGYLSETAQVLTEAEIENLAFSALLMTLECGIRFLTDYLDGDVYFRISYEKHNLERARCQLSLVKSMEENMGEMKRLIQKLITENGADKSANSYRAVKA